MHLLRLAALSFSLSLGAFAASSDNYTYGSAAWGAAKSWERSNEVHYQRNSSPNVDMSAAKSDLDRLFRSMNNAQLNLDRSPVYVSPTATPPARAVREPTYYEKLQARARAGDAAAMFDLAKSYSLWPDTQAASLGWAEAAANAGNLDGMVLAYTTLLNGNFNHPKDVPRAMGWLKKLADTGNADGQRRFGAALLAGKDIMQDKPLAFQYLKKLSEHTFWSRDHLKLGDLYLAGEGVEKNPEKAIECYWAGVKSEDGESKYEARLRLARTIAAYKGDRPDSKAEIKAALGGYARARVDSASAVDYVPSHVEAAIFYARILDTEIGGPRDMPAALENYVYALQENAPVDTPDGKYRMSEAEMQTVYERTFEIYLEGDGVPRDLAKAREVGLNGVKACKTFHPLALGFMLVDPKLGPPEPASALVCFNAHLGNSDALRESAMLLMPKSVEEALRRFDALWAKGDGEAAAWPADYHRQTLKWDPSDKRGSRENSRLWARRGAEKGRSDCMARLGIWLGEDARLAPKPEVAAAMRAEGLAWLKRSAEAQNEFAMAMLGEALLAGNDAEKNSAEALAWIKKSIELGSPQGKLQFANLLIAGKHVPPDKATALKLLGEAAPDSPAAANSYGVSLWRGDLGRQDVAEGLKWLEASLKARYWPAGRNLAKIYHLGSGVPKDETRAGNYLRDAIFAGQEPAKRLVAEAYEKGEIINANEEMAKTLYEELDRDNPAQNAVLLAAYYLRRGWLAPARRAVEKGESAGSAEAIKLAAEIEAAERNAASAKLAKGERILAEALPHVREKLVANLVLLEAAAAKPTENRPAFFHYYAPGTGNFEKDYDYQAVELLPQSPGSEMFLVGRDMEEAVEGNFNAAQVDCSGYYHRDPVLGPRYFAAIRKLVFADANGGDTSAMVQLVNLLGVPSDERPHFGWPRDHRESFRWCRRALLAGDAGGLDDTARLCRTDKPAENIDPKILAQWTVAIEKVREIQKNEAEPAPLIAAYCKDHLPPE